VTVRSSKSTFDVAIIGGGPAGSAAAIRLARAGSSVILIEKESRREFKAGETLPPEAKPLLSDLGVGVAELNEQLASYGNESAWGSDRLVSNPFIKSPYGKGWHLDRPGFDQMLRRVARNAGACVLDDTAVTGIRGASPWRLRVSRGFRGDGIECSWLIDCSGPVNWLGRQVGIERIRYDRLIATVTTHTISSADSHSDRDCSTVIESVPDGWWYTSLVPGGRRVVAYLTDADLRPAATLRAISGFTAIFRQTQHISSRLSEYTLEGTPRTVTASSSRLIRLAGEGWIAAGDAAMSFDPLSSLGIFSALYSGMKSAEALLSNAEGDSFALLAYEKIMSSLYERYLMQRRDFYSLEQRWPRQEFWIRRSGLPEH
jgi:flavin-dependent dehydrogenase